MTIHNFYFTCYFDCVNILNVILYNEQISQNINNTVGNQSEQVFIVLRR